MDAGRTKILKKSVSPGIYRCDKILPASQNQYKPLNEIPVRCMSRILSACLCSDFFVFKFFKTIYLSSKKQYILGTFL
jgi:hypothetical protein